MSKLTTSKVAIKLDVSVRTLLTWYKWYEQEGNTMEDVPVLPKYEQAYHRAPRFWEESDIEQLKVFKDWLPKGRNGVMGNVNAKNWGDRGRRALANKRLKKPE